MKTKSKRPAPRAACPILTAADVARARRRIGPFVVRTPVLSAPAGEPWLKLESLQPTGSFKVRPAFNSILAEIKECRARGVVASSSGNFAQAVAYAARTLGVDSVIVMPQGTSQFKIDRTRALGGKVEMSGPSFEERWELTERLRLETGRVFVHPYDSLETIAGDATMGLELLEQVPGPLTVIVPCSGGGLLAATAFAVKTARRGSRVVGVQPAAGGAMKKSLAEGRRVKVPAFRSLADALIATCPGERTFALVQKFVDEVVTVEDDELIRAVAWLARERKIVAEPGGASAVAAVLGGRVQAARGPIVCVVSGGNVAPEALARYLS